MNIEKFMDKYPQVLLEDVLELFKTELLEDAVQYEFNKEDLQAQIVSRISDLEATQELYQFDLLQAEDNFERSLIARDIAYIQEEIEMLKSHIVV